MIQDFGAVPEGLTTILIKEVSLFGFDDCRVQNTKYLVKGL